jgi:hypothetical protein
MSSIDRAALAALIAIAAACKAPDAVDPDAMMTDASPADASLPAPVHITVLDPLGNGSVLLGTTLVFDDAQGHFVSTLVVTSNDAIDVRLPEGTTVTAVFETGVNQWVLETVFGVSPGDVLRLTGSEGDHSSPRSLAMTYPDVAGATYDFGVPCDNNVFYSGIALDHDCPDGPAFVVAHPQSGGDEFLEVDTLPAPPATNVDFTGPWHSLEPFSGTWTNVPQDVALATVHRDPDHYEDWHDFWAGLLSSGTTVTASGMAASTTAPETVSTSMTRANLAQLILERTPGNQLTYQLDVGAALLPWISSQFDLGTDTFQITSEGGAVTPDLLVASLSYTRPIRWTLFSPVAASIQLPQLPDSFADLLPTFDDYVKVGVGGFEWSDVDDYAACLRHFDDTLGGKTYRTSADVTRITN